MNNEDPFTHEEQSQVEHQLRLIAEAAAKAARPEDRRRRIPIVGVVVAATAGVAVALGLVGVQTNVLQPAEDSVVADPGTTTGGSDEDLVRWDVTAKPLIEIETLTDLTRSTSIVVGTVTAQRSGEPSGVADDRLVPNIVTIEIDKQLSGEASLPEKIDFWAQYTMGDQRVVYRNQPWLEPGDRVLIGISPIRNRDAARTYGGAGPSSIYEIVDGRVAVPEADNFTPSNVQERLDGLSEEEAVQLLTS